jgi:hypothetical protein
MAPAAAVAGAGSADAAPVVADLSTEAWAMLLIIRRDWCQHWCMRKVQVDGCKQIIYVARRLRQTFLHFWQNLVACAEMSAPMVWLRSKKITPDQ